MKPAPDGAKDEKAFCLDEDYHISLAKGPVTNGKIFCCHKTVLILLINIIYSINFYLSERHFGHKTVYSTINTLNAVTL